MKPDEIQILDDFDIFLKAKKSLSKSTISSYKTDVVLFLDFLNENNISDFKELKESHINIFLSAQNKASYKSSTLARRLSSLKIFFRFLLDMGIIDNYLIENIKMPPLRPSEPKFLDIEEIELLLSYDAGSSDKAIRDKSIIELIYATGIKASELINLKLSDINITLGYIRCGSASLERVIPLASTAQEALLKYIDKARHNINKKDSELLFLNMRGNGLSRQGFWKIIKNYAISAGIRKEVNPNILRHSFAKHLLENGADIKTVQDLLGHSSILSVQMYISKDKARLRDVYLKAHPRA